MSGDEQAGQCSLIESLRMLPKQFTDDKQIFYNAPSIHRAADELEAKDAQIEEMRKTIAYWQKCEGENRKVIMEQNKQIADLKTPEWYYDEDAESRADWTDVLDDFHPLRICRIWGAVNVWDKYAVLFPLHEDDDADEGKKLFNCREDAERAIADYKAERAASEGSK